MQNNPEIVKIESQVCISTAQFGDIVTKTYREVGIDQDGQRWIYEHVVETAREIQILPTGEMRVNDKWSREYSRTFVKIDESN